MDVDGSLSQALQSLSYALSDGIKVQLGNGYGKPEIDVNLASLGGSHSINVDGLVSINRSQTKLQEYQELLNTLLEVRKLPDHSKKLLKDKTEVEESIDDLVLLIHKETQKLKEEEGLNEKVET